MALALGRTLQELESSMTAQEYGLWMALWSQEPWGDERMDVGFAVVASTLANINRRKDARPFGLADFMPYRRDSEQQDESADPETTPMQFIAGLQAMEAKRHG